MSRTYKLIRYENGQPVRSRNLNKEVPYRYFRHEHPIARRKWNRSKRHKLKQYLKKFGYLPKIPKTNGWLTY